MNNLNKKYEELLSEAVDVFGNAKLDPIGIATLGAFAMEEGIIAAVDIYKCILPLIKAKQRDKADMILEAAVQKKLEKISLKYEGEISELPSEYRINRRSDLECMLRQSVLNGIIFGMEVISQKNMLKTHIKRIK